MQTIRGYEGDDGKMRSAERMPRRRSSLYVKQNKAYQALLATLIIVFIVVTAVVVNSTLSPSSSWKDNVLIRMIIERSAVRGSR
jgi:membrane protein CcdC involved in cytochrome C biogenesis